MDGANMNAQVGLTNWEILVRDVCHLNLHKNLYLTVVVDLNGAYCVAEHLCSFLPEAKWLKELEENKLSTLQLLLTDRH